MRDARPWTALRVAALCLLSLSAGVLLGRVVWRDPPPIVQRPDVRPFLPAVVLEEIEGGLLKGRVNGSVRLSAGDSAVLLGSGAFAVTLPYRYVPEAPPVIPEGAAFVASVRGTRYYPVSSPQGRELSPANRVYFASRAEAEAAGYVPWDLD